MRAFLIRRRLLLVPVGALFLVGLLFVLRVHLHASETPIDPKPPGGYRIERTKDGFSPSTLTIPLGESVTFTTALDVPFWPASNVHPSHTIYPDFDPKRSLAPEEEWTFTPQKPGRWRFHDHLFASAEGLLVVIDQKGVAPRQPTNLTDCVKIPIGSKQQCWDDLLAYTLKAKGFSAAFDLFTALYETEPEVPKACHGWGHSLGQAAYEMYRAGTRFSIPSQASYCGYGFYHGFLERLVGETGDAKQAYQFCLTVKAQTPTQPSAYDNCIHGIGHGGAASIIENPVMYGKYQASVTRGAALCRSFTSDPDELRKCDDGVFNELVLDMWNGQYGLSREQDLLTEDPYVFCRAQKDELKVSCYFEYTGFFEQLFHGDFMKAAAYVARAIPNLSHAEIAIRKLAADFMQSAIVHDSYAPEVAVCASLPKALEVECINGLGIGLLAHGEPNKEYIKALAFCGSGLPDDAEAKACYASMLYHFDEVYDDALFAKACAITPEVYRPQRCLR